MIKTQTIVTRSTDSSPGRAVKEVFLYPTETKLAVYSLVAQMVKDLPAMQETWVQSLGREELLEKGMATHSIFLPGEFQGQSSLAGYSPLGLQRVGQD